MTFSLSIKVLTWPRETGCLYDYESRRVSPVSFKTERKSVLVSSKNDVALLDPLPAESCPAARLAEINPSDGTAARVQADV